jgi:hypothetical protein
MEQLIHGKVIDVMADMEALGKDRRNTQQGYNFRGIDDVYNMVQPIMAKHGIIMRSEILAERSEERQSKGGSTLIYRVFQIRYFLMAKDGSEISTVVMGEGMDSGDKAANKAMSVAQKYAILQMFMIPTEEAKDPEHDSPEVKGKDKKPQPSAPATEGKTKDKSADKPAPMTDDQMKEIASHIEISGLKDITSAMAKTVISTLQKWTATELKKKMDAANNSPANDGATGGPSDPGEGSEGDRG